MLRVFESSGGDYAEIWTTPVSGLDSLFLARPLSLDGSELAVGLSAASYGSLTGAGEVRIFERKSASTWELQSTRRATDAVDNLGLGRDVSLNGGRILSTNGLNGTVYNL